MTIEKLERKIYIRPGFDKRNKDPKKNYGIHCAELVFEVHGKHGVLRWFVFTNWFLPAVEKELEDKPKGRPNGAWLDYHSKKKTTMSNGKCKCDILGHCYPVNLSLLFSDSLFKILVTEGSDKLWKELEAEYYNMAYPKKEKKKK